MRVTEIHRYPVKSLLGERLTGTALGPAGIPGDRAWALRDEVRGGLTGGKRFPALMSMAARFAREPDDADRSPEVRIRLSDGTEHSSSSGSIDEALSTALEHRVSLWPLLPAEDLDHYRREPGPPDADPVAELRALFGRTPDEPLPELSGFPAVLASHHTPPGTYFDAYPLLIMTRASLRAMAERVAKNGLGAQFDVRRFRPNLLLDDEAASTGFLENDWSGRRLRIGGAVVNVEMVCPRCVMTTHEVQALPREPKIMRALVEHNDGNLGVYASVSEPGRVALGDTVTVL